MPRKLSSLDQRVRKLEQEKRLVEKDIRKLTRAISKPRPVGAMEIPDTRPARGRKSRSAAPAAQKAGSSSGGRSTAQGKRRKTSSVLQVSTTADARFPSYLAGSISSSRPLKQERSVQRNKALFMLLFVFVVAFVVIQLVFK